MIRDDIFSDTGSVDTPIKNEPRGSRLFGGGTDSHSEVVKLRTVITEYLDALENLGDDLFGREDDSFHVAFENLKDAVQYGR